MACVCQKCGNKYKMDLLIPDDLWAEITPSKHKEGGLLCPSCIVKEVERLRGYSTCTLTGKEPIRAKQDHLDTLETVEKYYQALNNEDWWDLASKYHRIKNELK